MSATPAPPRTSWTATELMAWDFPEPRWAVPGVLAEGANLLVGPPKVGKSWLALNLAVAVAAGGRALGTFDVEAGDVLYLALEDTGRRLQSRLGKVLAHDPPTDRLTFTVACERLSSGGYDRISTWLDAHSEARLVIVDVLARVRDHAAPNASAYDVDYRAMASLKALADEHSVCLLVVHHTRKAGSEDFLDLVSGTQGLAGAADAVLVLTRGRTDADARLRITGRDVEEADHALQFSPALGTWTRLDGPAEDYELADTRRTILRYLREHGPAAPKELAAALSLDYENVKKTMRRMADDDQLAADGRGTYTVPVTLSPVSLPSLTEGDRDSRDTRDTPTGDTA